MKKPQMILFDYGQTLLYEPGWDSNRGNLAMMRYMTKNPNGCTAEDIQREADAVFGELSQICTQLHYDVPCTTAQQLIYDHLGIELALTPLEREIVFWTAATPGAVVPYADVMLDYLNHAGIRTAVISNNGWSGAALKERFDRLLPDNRFEFILSSADYLIRKPDKRLFEIALSKAGLSAEQVWYCGDSIQADVLGAHNAGIFPVHYEGGFDAKETSGRRNNGLTVDFEYLHLHDWRELIRVLKS